ncbi:WD-40 repeat protein [Reticulomyxa filosa]|uniref:WD-40 repeat protein n=1 Tax=Reticulomyxa filosa TaxID=46433 RepID=X6P8F6_RETFI|nr:WD-40 repeat protein [Reticulomyxa filosa]|eukprot:ETO34830.1 WD-40 repeat protein [Reticulomyxa filosa]
MFVIILRHSLNNHICIVNFEKKEVVVEKVLINTFENTSNIDIDINKLKLYFSYIKQNKTSTQLPLPKEEEIPLIIQHWIKILHIKFGWIYEFDKLVVNYVMFIYFFFYAKQKIQMHTDIVWSIDYSTFGDGQFICSGSGDETVRVWDVDNNKQIQSLHGHLFGVFCVKFSRYHYHHHRKNVICSSSLDNTIRFWDIKHNKQLQILYEHDDSVYGIEFSPLSGGRYLCSGSTGATIRLWDVATSKSLHVFNRHERTVWCVDISPLQSNNDNKSNNIGVIDGHTNYVMSVKYGSNELLNTILSGSFDNSVRLWDIRSGQQIQAFDGHTRWVHAVEYSPLVIKNSDNTIRFWDIRSNKNELYIIKGDNEEDNGIYCLKFISLKRKEKINENARNATYDLNLCYGSRKLLEKSKKEKYCINAFKDFRKIQSGKLIKALSYNSHIMDVKILSNNQKILVATMDSIEVFDIISSEAKTIYNKWCETA